MTNFELKGKELNQELLTKLAHKMNVIGDSHAFNETFTDLQNKTLTEIISDTLWFANDLYLEGIYNKNDLIEINDIIIILRKKMI